MNLTEYEALTPNELIHYSRAVVDSLGAHWSGGPSPEALGAVILRYAPLECDFVLVLGGKLHMGLAEEDRLPLVRHVDWDWVFEDRWNDLVRAGSPTREVVVAPFLCAVTCMTEQAQDGKCLSLRRQQALEYAAQFGFRLPSEAEFEWIAREGRGVGFNSDLLHDIDEQTEEHQYWPDHRKFNRFGVRDMFVRQWVADDWHPNYEGAPLTSAAWLNGDAIGVLRGDDKARSFELGPEVLVDQLAAARWPGDGKERPFRLALDVPSLVLDK